MADIAQKARAAAFAQLHREGCFVLANAWDIPSAALVARAGFPAIATTSSGVAFAHGLPDGELIGRSRMLAISAEIAGRTALPVSADLEAGYGIEPEAVAETVRLAIEHGLVGCNIEDSDPRTHGLFPFDLAVARIRAGAEAARQVGLPDFVLNARTDPFLLGRDPPAECFDESVRRANAYRAAGAASLFVPGPADAGTIGRLVERLEGPLNVLARPGMPPVGTLRELGVRRVSLGGNLMAAAYGFAGRLLETLAQDGDLGFLADAPGHGAMTNLIVGFHRG